jgi:hypothetical protein
VIFIKYAIIYEIYLVQVVHIIVSRVARVHPAGVWHKSVRDTRIPFVLSARRSRLHLIDRILRRVGKCVCVCVPIQNHANIYSPCSQCGTGLYAVNACVYNTDTECDSCGSLNPTINVDFVRKCLREETKTTKQTHTHNIHQHTSTRRPSTTKNVEQQSRRFFEKEVEEGAEVSMSTTVNPILDIWFGERKADEQVQQLVDIDDRKNQEIVDFENRNDEKSETPEPHFWTWPKQVHFLNQEPLSQTGKI